MTIFQDAVKGSKVISHAGNNQCRSVQLCVVKNVDNTARNEINVSKIFKKPWRLKVGNCTPSDAPPTSFLKCLQGRYHPLRIDNLKARYEGSIASSCFVLVFCLCFSPSTFSSKLEALKPLLRKILFCVYCLKSNWLIWPTVHTCFEVSFVLTFRKLWEVFTQSFSPHQAWPLNSAKSNQNFGLVLLFFFFIVLFWNCEHKNDGTRGLIWTFPPFVSDSSYQSPIFGNSHISFRMWLQL